MNLVSDSAHIRVLRVSVVLCVLMGIMVLTDFFSLFRAIGVMCMALSPFVFAYGYFYQNPWAKRIGVSMLICGVAFWFINADMGWQDRYCLLTPMAC